eukprot:g1530.t1
MAAEGSAPKVKVSRKFRRNYKVDEGKMQAMFARFDTDGNGKIDFEALTTAADLEAARGRVRRWASIEEPKLI